MKRVEENAAAMVTAAKERDDFNLNDLAAEAMENGGYVKEEDVNEELKQLSREVVEYITTIVDEYQGLRVLCNVPILKGKKLYYQPVVEDSSGGVVLMTPNTVDLAKSKVVKAIFNRTLAKYSRSGVGNASPTAMRDAVAAATKETKERLEMLFDVGFYGNAVGRAEVVNVEQVMPLRRWEPGINSFDELVEKAAGDRRVKWDNNGTVTVTTLNVNKDTRLEEAYNFMFSKLYSDPAQRKAVLQFFALAMFMDRSGMARPILYLLGAPGTGKSVTLELGRCILGHECSAPINADLSASRWIMPNRGFMTMDETPALEEGSKRALWLHIKKLSKAIGYTEWDIKNEKALKIKVGSYLAIASNHVAIAGGAGDAIDNIVSIKMNTVFNVSDWVMPDGTNAINLITSQPGVPYYFAKNVLWPVFMELTRGNHRFGMPIYEDPLFKVAAATISEVMYENSKKVLDKYCRFIGGVHQYLDPWVEHLDPMAGNFDNQDNFVSKGYIRFSDLDNNIFKETGSPYKYRVSIRMLKAMFDRSDGRIAVKKAFEIAADSRFYIKGIVDGKSNPICLHSGRCLILPREMCKAPSVTDFINEFREEIASCDGMCGVDLINWMREKYDISENDLSSNTQSN